MYYNKTPLFNMKDLSRLGYKGSYSRVYWLLTKREIKKAANWLNSFFFAYL